METLREAIRLQEQIERLQAQLGEILKGASGSEYERMGRAEAVLEASQAAGEPIPDGVKLVAFRPPTEAERAFGKSLSATGS